MILNYRLRSALLCAAGLSLVAGCGRAGGPPASQTPAAPGPPTVEVLQVVERPVDLTLDMPGELNPYQAVAIFPKVTGFVKSIRVDRGSHVRAGELLAELEAPELVSQRAESQSKLQAAQAQLAAARSKVDATTSTYDKLRAASATAGVVAGNDLVLAQKALEADRSQVDAVQQSVEAARQALSSITQMESYLKVTAPFDGTVTERNVHPGTLVGPASGPASATPLLRLVDNSRLRLVVPVPDAYIGGITAGTPISFSVAEFPGRLLSGKVARIAESVDVKTRTMPVEIEVANADGHLASGSFCQVRWPVRRAGASLFVPVRSVANTTGRTFVVRIQNGHTEWIDVKTGLTMGSQIEVFGDLKPGDVVATRGTDELRPGTEVRTTSPKAGA
jgi:membrane fusion protein, multidrug efflux system